MQLSVPQTRILHGKAFQSGPLGRTSPPRIRRQVPIRPTAKIPGIEQATAALKTYRAVSNLPSWVTTVAFTAFQVLPKITRNPIPFVPDSNLLFNVLAWYTLVYAGTSVFHRKVEFDGVGTVIGPAYLAVKAMGGVGSFLSPLNVATALFGIFLSYRLPGPTLLWLPTLAFAIYSGFGFHWAVAAFAGGAGWQLIQGLREGKLPLQQIAFLAVTAMAFVTNLVPQFALFVFGGQILASAVGH